MTTHHTTTRRTAQVAAHLATVAWQPPGLASARPFSSSTPPSVTSAIGSQLLRLPLTHSSLRAQ